MQASGGWFLRRASLAVYGPVEALSCEQDEQGHDGKPKPRQPEGDGTDSREEPGEQDRQSGERVSPESQDSKQARDEDEADGGVQRHIQHNWA